MEASDCQTMLADVVVGFEALLKQVEALRSKNVDLATRMTEYLQSHASHDRDEAGPSGDLSWIKAKDGLSVALDCKAKPEIKKAMQAIKLWRQNNRPKPAPEDEPQLDLPEGHPRVSLEQDFTTDGTPGKIGCPFSRMRQQATRGNDHAPTGTREEDSRPERLPTPASTTDQHQKDSGSANFHPATVHSPPASVAGCPIRFLDRRSPEELATYFEQHKHEIPRSHQVCVQRYQSNQDSIRELDAKYGNLVNMIQGLGVKHKPMLQENEQAVKSDREMDEGHVQKIQTWAENCSDTGDVPANALADVEERIPRFEQELSDVRLGESPSRPWGYQVPAPEEVDRSTAYIGGDDVPANASVQAPTSPVASHSGTRKEERSIRDEGSSKSLRKGIVFNGPVFIGYSAEEAASMFDRMYLGRDQVPST